MKRLIVFLLLSGTAWAQRPDIEIPIPSPVPTRLAVADFQPRSTATDQTTSTLKVFNEVLWNDLKFSSFFEMPSKSFNPLQDIRVPQDVDFESWQDPALNIDFVAFGNVQVYDAGVVVETYVYDIKTREQVFGTRYTVAEPSLVRRVAHQVADRVVFELSAGASQGVSQTQIAFTSLKGDSKEVYLMDYDGSNIRTITANGGLNKFPQWSSDNTKLIFGTKLRRSNAWEIWIQDLAGGRAVVPTPANYASSPAFSPNGEWIAFSSRDRGRNDADVFVARPDGSERKNLTRHSGIDTSPVWSPTGNQIAFVTDRTGTPQIWIVESDGTNLRRLVNEGGHCDSPSWSPDGRLILYSWQAPGQWKHDVFMTEVASGRVYQLTTGRGSHENPSWSPDGRHIVFQSTRTGSKQIFIMNADGENLKQITAYGINESPAWSSYFNSTR